GVGGGGGTGGGQLVDLSQLEAVASAVGPMLVAGALDAAVPAPTGSASQEAPAAPHGVYPCAGADRWIAITVFTDEEWRAFARVAGVRDDRFTTREARAANMAALDALVAGWTRTQVAEEAVALLQRAGVPAGVVANGEDLCA